MKNLSLIGAAALNWAIGYKGCIPWHISADFKYFKSITAGHTVIMGLGTWISLPGKPLPGRRNLVVSDRPATEEDLATGAEFFPTLESALEAAGTQEEVFCIGGGMMYRQTLPLAGKVYLTRVHTNVDPADTFFPKVEEDLWEESSHSELMHDDKSNLDFEFIVYTRKAEVYFTDFHTKMYGEGTPVKLRRLVEAAGFDKIDFDGKFVAIKMHFGEKGNMSFLRPNYARVIVDMVKSRGGKPFLTDCNTMYPGSRKNALEHLYCAWENGFTPLTVGCPILIGDGLKGTDDLAVPVRGGEYVKEAYIGHAIMDADIFISLTHFKGHEETGFGGALKNIGMGCGSRAGKKDQHSAGKALVNEELCRGCRKCQKECANEGLVFDVQKGKMTVDHNHCVGCGRCLGACNFDAIYFMENNANEMLCRRIAEYSKAVLDGRPHFHISLVLDVSPNCDCHGENDVPILPDIGMFASFDPVALDQACADACLAAEPMPGGQLYRNIHSEGFVDHHDHFKNSNPEIEWKACLEHAEKLDIGTRHYTLIKKVF